MIVGLYLIVPFLRAIVRDEKLLRYFSTAHAHLYVPAAADRVGRVASLVAVLR